MSLPRTARLSATLVAAIAVATSCGRVIAPPPPSGAPHASESAMVAGPPISVAARAARVLTDFTFTTRRFGSDSTWGYQAADSIHARLRYVRPQQDSTRVILELWGHCGKNPPPCGSLYAQSILQAIAATEAPPQ
jgi:hypothetical protein